MATLQELLDRVNDDSPPVNTLENLRLRLSAPALAPPPEAIPERPEFPGPTTTGGRRRQLIEQFGGTIAPRVPTAPSPPALSDPTQPESTIAEAARMFAENVPTLFKRAAGGGIQALAERAGPDFNIARNPIKPGQTYDEWRQERIEVWRAAPPGPLSELGAKIYADANADIAENSPNLDPESVKGYAYDLSVALANMVPMIVATVATRSPTVGLSIMGTQVYADRYGEQRAAGRSEAEARQDALFSALAETIPERIPLGIIMKQGGKLLPRLFAGAAAEGVQEVVTEVLQTGYNIGVLDENMTWGEALNRMKRAGLLGVGMGAGMAVITQPFVRGEAGDTPRRGFDLNVEGPLDFEDVGGPGPAAAPQAQLPAPIPPPPTETPPVTPRAAAEPEAVEAAAVAVRERHGLPETGQPVTVTDAEGDTITGTLEDVFEVDGTAQARIVTDRGDAVEVFLDDVTISQGSGVQAADVAAAQPPAVAPPLQSAPTQPEPAPRAVEPGEERSAQVASLLERAQGTPDEAPPEISPAPAAATPVAQSRFPVSTGNAKRDKSFLTRTAGRLAATAGIDRKRLLVRKEDGFWTLTIDRPTPEESRAVEAEIARQQEISARRGVAARGAKRTRPRNIVEFIASIGGISDPDGDLAAMEAQRTFVPGSGPLVRAGARHPDKIRRAAAEAGYIPEDTDTSVLYEAIRETLQGRPVFVKGDDQEAINRIEAEQAAEDDRVRFDEARTEISEFSKEFGISATEDEIAEVATIVRETGRDPLDALEEYSERKAIQEMDDHIDAAPEEDDIPFEEIADETIDDQQGRSGEVAAQEVVGQERAARPPQEDAPGRDVVEPSGQGQEGRRQDVTTEQATAGTAAEPITETTDQGEQTVIPGAEKISDRELAERRGQGRKKAAVEQKPPDEGLFDVAGRGQKDLLDQISEPEAAEDTGERFSLFDREAPAPPFYSKALRVIGEARTAKAPGPQWLATLKNAGVKDEEIAWLGLDTFLAGKTSVSRADLDEFVRTNQVQVEMIVKGGELTASANEQAALDQALDRAARDGDIADETAIDLMDGALDGDSRAIGEIEGLGIDDRLIAPFRDRERVPTKFSSFVLPGGESYREILLTLQVDQNAAAAARSDRVKGLIERRDALQAQMPEAGVTGTATAELRRQIQNAETQIDLAMKSTDLKGPTTFTGGHFDEPNVLAHVRFNERTVDGKRILFIEEIQSDWMQKGRRQGFVTEAERSLGFATAEAQQLAEQHGLGRGVPDAPFKKTWHELAFRRMVRYAAENGFDSVAWTTGAQQADRFDLSKRIKAVVATKQTKRGVDYKLEIVPHSGRMDTVFVAEADLPEYVGKDLADKIIENGGGSFSGLDLRVGGEGMATFYDRMLPQYANKLGKKFGAKVGRVEIETVTDLTRTAFEDAEETARRPLSNTIAVHHFQITDKLREIALSEGFPLFAVGTARDQNRLIGDPTAQEGLSMAERREQVQAALRAELDSMGLSDIGLRVADQVFAQVDGKKTEIQGFYYKSLIDVSLQSPDVRRTLNHEALHALRDLDLIKDDEWAALERKVNATWRAKYRIDSVYAHLPDWIRVEEAVAHAYGDWASGQTRADGLLARAFERIKRFLRAVGRALRGLGYRNAEDVFASMQEGTVGRRRQPVSDDAATFAGQAVATFGEKVNAEALRKAVQRDRKEMFSLFGDSGGTSVEARDAGDGSIEIEERSDVGDLNIIKRYLYTPEKAFKRWPALAQLQKFGVKIEMNMSAFITRLMHDYDLIRGRLSKKQFEQLGDVLFVGDAEQTEFTNAQLEEMDVDAATATAYRDIRRLFDKIGRFVDNHRRDMMPQVRKRKVSVLRRMARIREMDDPEFRRLYARRTKLRRQLRLGEGNPSALAGLLEEIEAQLGDIREQTDEFQTLSAEIDRLDAALAQTSVRRRAGYVPHKFFGSWAVYEIAEPEEGGEPVHTLVAGEHGFHPDRDSAIRAAKAHLAANEDADLVVRPVQFQFPASEATSLTDASYWRFVGRVSKALEITGDDLRDAVQGVARRKFRRRIAGFAQFRKGIPGYSRDFDRVMTAHISEAVRYVMLDKLKYRAINTMERMGLSPYRSANQERGTLQAAVNAFLRDVNGEKQPVERQLDEIFDKPFFKPLGTAVFSGGAVASLTTFGVAANPLVGGLLGSYVGYRLYRALKDGGSFKTRALTGAMLGDMAHAKLGAFFNVYSAVVNLSQTMINTYPVLGERYTLVAMKLLFGAASSRFAGKPNRYWQLLGRADIATKYRYGDQPTQQFTREGRIAAASLFLFNNAEQFNRSVAFLGGYQRAIDKGASEAEAMQAGVRVMIRTQFHYGSANKPEILRSVVLRVPLQFKNFMIQEIMFIGGLKKKTELPRFLLALFLMAGLLGMPGIDLLDALLDLWFDFSPLDEIKKQALEMQAQGELEGAAGNLMARGLPSLLGDDLSMRIGVGEKFLPAAARDFWGPWISTAVNARRLGELNATTADHMRNLVPGLGKPLKSLEAAANGLPIETAITEPVKFYEALADGKIVYTNPYQSGALDFDERILSRADLVRMGLGGTPLQVAQIRDIQGIRARETQKLDFKRKRFLNRIVKSYRLHRGDFPKLTEVLEEVAADAEAADVVITKEQVDRALERGFTPRILRMVKQTRRELRPEIWGLVKSAVPELAEPAER